MWWIVLLMIFFIGLIIKNYNWLNILTKHKLKRNQRKTYKYNYEYDGDDWNGYRWYDGYNLHEWTVWIGESKLQKEVFLRYRYNYFVINEEKAFIKRVFNS